MADLTTISSIEAELAATADYDVENDVAKAKRRVAALRRKLDFPSSMGRDQQTMQFAVQTIENQLNQALQFIQASASPSEAQRLVNPSVVHADFSTFRGYSSGGCSE
jgi:hypothetical protein